MYEQLSIVLELVLCKNKMQLHIDGSVQNCSNSIANALELLQSCTKLAIDITSFPRQKWCVL